MVTIPFLSRVRSSVLCFSHLDKVGPYFVENEKVGLFLCFHCYSRKGPTKQHVVTLRVTEAGIFEVTVSHPCTKKMDPKGYLAAMSRAYQVVTCFSLESKA